MSRFCDRPFARLALIGALAAAFALAGCGRKGPLDPPPGASLVGEPQANMPNLMSKNRNTPVGGEAKQGKAGVDAEGEPIAAKGQHKQFPLDALLN